MHSVSEAKHASCRLQTILQAPRKQSVWSVTASSSPQWKALLCAILLISQVLAKLSAAVLTASPAPAFSQLPSHPLHLGLLSKS